MKDITDMQLLLMIDKCKANLAALEAELAHRKAAHAQPPKRHGLTLFDRPMTTAERVRRHRAIKRAKAEAGRPTDATAH